MIVQAPARVLSTACEPVDVETGRAIAAELHRGMLWAPEHDGRGAAGLSAPQIGKSARVFVLAGRPSAFINPEILGRSPQTSIDVEGCLSLPPTVAIAVRRAKWIKLRFTTEGGVERTVKLHGRDARAALHELDHLDGILITDYQERAA